VCQHTLFLKDLYDNLKLSVTISGLLTAWSSSTHLVRGTGLEHSSIRYRFERISSDEVRAFFLFKKRKMNSLSISKGFLSLYIEENAGGDGNEGNLINGTSIVFVSN
jgi:hypothetical protein